MKYFQIALKNSMHLFSRIVASFENFLRESKVAELSFFDLKAGVEHFEVEGRRNIRVILILCL